MSVNVKRALSFNASATCSWTLHRICVSDLYHLPVSEKRLKEDSFSFLDPQENADIPF